MIQTITTLKTGTKWQSLCCPRFCPTIVKIRGTRIWIALPQTHNSIYDIYVHVYIMCHISVMFVSLHLLSQSCSSPLPPYRWTYEIPSLFFSSATRKWSQFGKFISCCSVLMECYILKIWICFDLVRTVAILWKENVPFFVIFTDLAATGW